MQDMTTTSLRLIAILGLSGVLGCRNEPSAPEFQQATLGTPVTLSPGQTAIFSDASLQVRFVSVLRESRCPSDVLCIWGGSARFIVELSSPSHTVLVPLETDGPEREALAGSFRIETRSLAPNPVSTHPIRPDRYRATLRVTRAE